MLYIAGFVGSTNASYVANWLLTSIADGESHSSFEGQLSLASTSTASANHGMSHSVLYQLWGSATTFPLLFLFYQVSMISSWETLFLDEASFLMSLPTVLLFFYKICMKFRESDPNNPLLPVFQ